MRRYTKLRGAAKGWAEKAGASKGWTDEEDRKVIELVQTHGPKKWNHIARELPGKTGTADEVNTRFISYSHTNSRHKITTQDGLVSNVENDGIIISIHKSTRPHGQRMRIGSSYRHRRMGPVIVGLILPNIYPVGQTMPLRIIGIPV